MKLFALYLSYLYIIFNISVILCLERLKHIYLLFELRNGQQCVKYFNISFNLSCYVYSKCKFKVVFWKRCSMLTVLLSYICIKISFFKVEYNYIILVVNFQMGEKNLSQYSNQRCLVWICQLSINWGILDKPGGLIHSDNF